MEAVMIAGLAVLAVGGYYSFIDLMNDLGFQGKRFEAGNKRSPVSQRYVIAPQARV